ITPEQLALIAARAMVPKPKPAIMLSHLHAPTVSVREQAAIIVARLRRTGASSFRTLVADADTTLLIVARFLALLELFRESVIAFEQAEALGELTVRWTGTEQGDIEVSDEFDDGIEREAERAAEPEGDVKTQTLIETARGVITRGDIPKEPTDE
ncbi:MAG TPA: segregation/condensation protein A, partial [Candidatus Lustribacter sp.]|nr:segregation/condensation protein A [Candidatus Lustribacter sp.]